MRKNIFRRLRNTNLFRVDDEMIDKIISSNKTVHNSSNPDKNTFIAFDQIKPKPLTNWVLKPASAIIAFVLIFTITIISINYLDLTKNSKAGTTPPVESVNFKTDAIPSQNVLTTPSPTPTPTPTPIVNPEVRRESEETLWLPFIDYCDVQIKGQYIYRVKYVDKIASKINVYKYVPGDLAPINASICEIKDNDNTYQGKIGYFYDEGKLNVYNISMKTDDYLLLRLVPVANKKYTCLAVYNQMNPGNMNNKLDSKAYLINLNTGVMEPVLSDKNLWHCIPSTDGSKLLYTLTEELLKDEDNNPNTTTNDYNQYIYNINSKESETINDSDKIQLEHNNNIPKRWYSSITSIHYEDMEKYLDFFPAYQLDSINEKLVIQNNKSISLIDIKTKEKSEIFSVPATKPVQKGIYSYKLSPDKQKMIISIYDFGDPATRKETSFSELNYLKYFIFDINTKKIIQIEFTGLKGKGWCELLWLDNNNVAVINKLNRDDIDNYEKNKENEKTEYLYILNMDEYIDKLKE